jgi:hypothetical protein
MRRYRTFFPGYWTSADIVDLPNDSKLLGAYLLTSPHANMIGCYRLPNAYVSEDLRMGSRTVGEGFRNLCDRGFITHDSTFSWVLINKFLKWNPIENPNQGIAASKLVCEVPRNSSVYAPLLEMLKANSRNFPAGFIDGLGTVREPYRNQEQEQEPYPYPQPIQEPIPDLLASSSHEQPADAVFNLPLEDGSQYGLPKTLYETYVETYKAIDVMEQLTLMRAWLISNPGRRKTRAGIKDFINGWLKRERDKPDSAPRKRAPRTESFGAIDYQKSYGLPPGENVGLI